MEPLIEDSIADSFEEEFRDYWEDGLSGKEILEKFHEMNLTELKLYQIYYCAKKFKLQKRYKNKIAN